jgi:hypothetical protein
VTEPLESFARRELGDWRGLPEGTRLADLAGVVEVDPEYAGRGLLGNTFAAADWVGASADGFPHGIRIWRRGEDVVLLDAEGAQPADDLDELLAELGEPAVRREAWLGPVKVDGSEWVYPQRGLTIYTIPGSGTVDRVLAYAATTLDGYDGTLRPDNPMHPFPEAGG